MLSKLTKEQEVVIKVCDEWLKEAGLPSYGDLQKQADTALVVQLEKCKCSPGRMCAPVCKKVAA